VKKKGCFTLSPGPTHEYQISNLGFFSKEMSMDLQNYNKEFIPHNRGFVFYFKNHTFFVWRRGL
jgi:hypothetical protein